MQTYRDILSQAFQDRSGANSSYSMRAFARDLGMPTSTLSEVLNGKKGISPKRAENIAVALHLPDWQIRLFCDLVTQDHAKSPRVRQQARRRLKGLKQENSLHLLSDAALRALTSWVDLAILELTHLREFRPSDHWVAKKIGVSQEIAAASLDRLKTAKLLTIDENSGAWVDASPLFSTTDGLRNESIRRFHRSVLQLAMQKLEKTSVEERTVKTTIFSISEDRLPRAKQILNEAIAKIVSLADESNQERVDVMCFSAQLFSVLETKGKL